MNHCEFVLPASKEDLCSSFNNNQYVVSDILPIREVASEVMGLQRTLADEGPDMIVNQFNVFYSVLRHFAKLEEDVKAETWQIISSVATKLAGQMALVIDDSAEHVDSETRFKYRTLLKMTVYIMCQLAESFEIDATKPSTEVLVAGGKGQRKKSKRKDACTWEEDRENFVFGLHQFCELPIKKLWDPPVVEEEFLNLMTGCCFKLLENPSVVRNKSMKDIIFGFLGTTLKKYSNTLGYSVKIIQILQHFEHLVSPLAQAVHIFVTEYGARNLISEIIREIGYMDTRDLSRDTSGMRSLSQFIVELAEKIPAAVMSSISLLLPYLDEEAYTMRNCVLSVLGEIVCRVLSGDELDEKSKEMRDQILDKLEEHIHDINAFVRSKCLQTWKQLCNEKSIPLPRQHHLLQLIIGRLGDKSCNVRKYAVQFLTVFLQGNPFAAKLPLEDLVANYEKEKKVLEEIMPEDPIPMEEDGLEDVAELDNENIENQENPIAVETESGGDMATSKGVVNEVSKQQILVQYLQDTVKFATQIAEALPVICQLLRSRTISDILEAIDFFVAAFEFGVRGAVQGVKQMLNLVWSKEAAVKEAIVSAYKQLYLKTEGTNPRSEAIKIAKNLTFFLHGATLSEIASVDELVKEFVKTGDISKHVIQVLWERFSKKLPDTTEEESHFCLMLLSMAAGSQPDIVKSNIDVLVSVGLGPRATEDFQLAKETCSALMKLTVSKPSMEAKDPPFRLPKDHDIFTRLAEILINGIIKIEDCHWTPMAEQAVSVIYNLAEYPDIICGSILKKLASIVGTQDTQKDLSENQTADDSLASCSSIVLGRFISISGHIALWQVMHLEVNIFTELKRRQNCKENSKRYRKSSTLRRSLQTPSSKTGDNIEDEMGLIGAIADDAEAEYIRKISETEILNGTNILGLVCPLVIAVSSDPIKYSNPDLCAAASLALAKFMMISTTFCENNMQLLITIMEKSSEQIIRANVIVALGDLATRFPNVIEPWTPHIYSRLKDPSVHVRKYTMIVLNHLILHDMIKVKGQISDMALCIVDEEEQISSLAKYFFSELSKKGNAVYNILPDIISRLSDPDCGASEETFKTVMRYLFQFIEKDRQVESLVEKLCHRVRAARTDKQCHELTFCLSQLTFNEKSLVKLQENLTCFGDKLKDNVVLDYFSTILTAAKKNANSKSETEVAALLKQLGLE